MITVVCVWVRANVFYPVEYVSCLRAMVARHLTRPHTFVCLTDHPESVPNGVQSVRISHDASLFGWWAKIELFRPGRFSGRVLYLDLDTLLVDALDEIVYYPASFAMVPPAGAFVPKNGLRTVEFGNSSVMAWDAGAADVVYLDWTPPVAARLWGDQDWIGEKVTQGTLLAQTMPASWFPRLSQLNGRRPLVPAKVVLVKKPKNEAAAALYPWFDQIWRAA